MVYLKQIYNDIFLPLISNIIEHPFLFLLVSLFSSSIAYVLYKSISLVVDNKNQPPSTSKVANFSAFFLFFLVIIFYCIYGWIFPYNRNVPIRPYENLLGLVAIVNAAIFLYLIFLGTSFIKKKFSSIWLETSIRIALTLLYSVLAYFLFFLLALSSCTFGAGECCC